MKLRKWQLINWLTQGKLNYGHRLHRYMSEISFCNENYRKIILYLYKFVKSVAKQVVQKLNSYRK